MTIKDFLGMCKLDDTKLSCVLNAHPKQFIDPIVKIPICEVRYRYLTQRGNKKEAVKYLFVDERDWDLVDNMFDDYITSFNEKNPERQLSNVAILDVEFLGNLILELE